MQKAITVSQQILFVLGFAAFITAAVHAADVQGQTYWRVGIAMMLTSITLGQVFTPRPASATASRPASQDA